MTRAQKDRLVEILEAIRRRHDTHLGPERLLREAATWQDVEEALALIRATETRGVS